MKYELHLNSFVQDQVLSLASTMHSWQIEDRVDAKEKKQISEQLISFQHTTQRGNIEYGGVDGSGDFPLLSYADSFIYLTTAQGTVYKTNAQSGLKEQLSTLPTLVNFAWLPENREVSAQELDKAFEALAGESILKVIERSDYRVLKRLHTHSKNTIETLNRNLLRPVASDSGNLAIQLRSTAEFGVAIRLIQQSTALNYLLMDTTYALPLLTSKSNSLFFEHLKRLCCVEALKKGTGFFTLSKSHNLPAMETIEEIACENQKLEKGKVAEHWYLRLPKTGIDDWTFSLAEGKQLPPIGAMSYLVRFHRKTPVMRLDMDINFWKQQIQSQSIEETVARETRIFEDLDYASHDQRVYGYPYPIKASHNRASLTNAERMAFRKQVIAAAVKQGIKPSLFRDPSIATGHK